MERIASILHESRHLPLAYGLLFGMPGVPALYYGSEWGIQGRKADGDNALRPALDQPEWNDLTAGLPAWLRPGEKALPCATVLTGMCTSPTARSF